VILRLYLAFAILLLGLLMARREGDKDAAADHARAAAQHSSCAGSWLPNEG